MPHNLSAAMGLPQPVSSLGYRSTLDGIPVGLQLRMLDRFHAARLYALQQKRLARQFLLRELRRLAENGKVAVVERGRDCDGVRYWGHPHEIDATPQAYDDLYNRVAAWADGPFAFHLARPSDAVESGSRDLGSEAFEDGHAHVIFD